MKTKANEDWNYLKKTMNGDRGFKLRQDEGLNDDKDDDKDLKFSSKEMIEFHEKVDTLLEKEEEIISTHMNLIKENAQLLTREGELIAYV